MAGSPACRRIWSHLVTYPFLATIKKQKTPDSVAGTRSLHAATPPIDTSLPISSLQRDSIINTCSRNTKKMSGCQTQLVNFTKYFRNLFIKIHEPTKRERIKGKGRQKHCLPSGLAPRITHIGVKWSGGDVRRIAAAGDPLGFRQQLPAACADLPGLRRLGRSVQEGAEGETGAGALTGQALESTLSDSPVPLRETGLQRKRARRMRTGPFYVAEMKPTARRWQPRPCHTPC